MYIMSNNNKLLDSLYYNFLEFDIIKDSSLSSKIFTGLIAVGLFTKFYLGSIIKTSDGSNGTASSLIWGYTIVVFSFISMIFLNSVSGNYEDYNSISGILKLFPIPIILLILLLLWEISIASKYKVKLNKREAPELYYKFSRYSTIILTFQIIITTLEYSMNMIVKQRNVGMKANSQDTSSVTEFLTKLSSANFILIFINFILIAIKQVILQNYTVDGDSYTEFG